MAHHPDLRWVCCPACEGDGWVPGPFLYFDRHDGSAQYDRYECRECHDTGKVLLDVSMDVRDWQEWDDQQDDAFQHVGG